MLNSTQLICIIVFFDLRVYLLACTNVHSDYGLQRRLNSDTGHLDLQKHKSELQTAHVWLRSLHMRNTRQFLQQSSAITKLPNTQIRLRVLKVCQNIKYASAFLHTYYNLSDQM